MALSQFAEFFKDTYQENFQKRTIAMRIASTELRSDLVFGKGVTRFRADFSNVFVRDVVKLTDGVVDPINDSSEQLLVNKRKETMFAIDEVQEITQAGPLKPAIAYGMKTAKELAIAVDADVLAETINAFSTFDTGSLTTVNANGTPIALASSNVEQVMTRTKAFLSRNNIDIENVCWVIDSLGASEFEQKMIARETDVSNPFWSNGYKGSWLGAEVYLSENLTGEAVLDLTVNPTAGDVISIKGIQVEFVAALTGAGQVLIGATVADTRTNLVGLLNNPASTTGTYQAFSTANSNAILFTLRLEASISGTSVVVQGIGSGRLFVASTFTNAGNLWLKSFIHSYYGRKGAIDVVIQKELTMEMRKEPKQTTTNIINQILYGIKTFTDGADQFLDVHIGEAVINN